MAITAKDKHGTYGAQRRTDGPGLDRSSARHYAIVDGSWSKGFKTRREAASAEREMKTRAEAGVALSRSGLTFGEFLDTVWLPLAEAKAARGQMKVTTVSHYRIVANRYIKPALGDVRLRDLRPARVRALYADLASKGKLSSKSVRNVHVLVSNALSLAVSDGYLPNNPAKARDVAPAAHSPEMKYWNPEQAHTFLASVADDRLFALWRLYVLCGLRRGEALALRWSDIDLTKGTLRVDRNLVVDPQSHKLVWQSPKTAKSRRTIDLDPATVEALRRHRKQQAAERLAADVDEVWPEGKNDPATDLVFTDEVGQPLQPHTVSRRFDAAIKRAGVERIRLHDTRHTAATIMLLAGVREHVVSRRLGHASAATTQDLYGHVLEEQATDAAERIAAAIDGV